MTKRPVPARRPWFMRRARLGNVPGLSLSYQLNISRTRSFIVQSLRLGGGLLLSVAAVAFATAGAAAATLFFAMESVAEGLELGLDDPADLSWVELRVAVETETALVAALVEMDVRQHVARAAR